VFGWGKGTLWLRRVMDLLDSKTCPTFCPALKEEYPLRFPKEIFCWNKGSRRSDQGCDLAHSLAAWEKEERFFSEAQQLVQNLSFIRTLRARCHEERGVFTVGFGRGDSFWKKEEKGGGMSSWTTAEPHWNLFSERGVTCLT